MVAATNIATMVTIVPKAFIFTCWLHAMTFTDVFT